ncbi:AAA family ATPase [Myroides sp.]|uniref:AAA family ATPase n=1 Tax=Myroides sp. TaxID=1874736 RepID=UPI003F3ADEFB
MSFKLLAIRPLEGTDPSLLKGLKPNCIYRFYNEYDYLYEAEPDDVSYIKYQEQYLSNVNNEKDGYLKLEHKPIKYIKYNKQIPNDFFGENINVSAIVGENGSGKSSLLELFYAFIYNYSILNGIIKEDTLRITINELDKENFKNLPKSLLSQMSRSIRCNLELYFLIDNNILCFSGLQVVFYLKDANNKYNLVRLLLNPVFVEIIRECERDDLKLLRKKLKLTSSKRDNFLYHDEVLPLSSPKKEYYKHIFLPYNIYRNYEEFLSYNPKIEVVEQFEKSYMYVYSIILNYSIYGLNSEVMGSWLKSLFHKNDGYQTPIVINPYREEGNININTEYILAQSRLLLNHYVIKNEKLLDNVKVKEIRFYLDCLKHQYLENQYNPITEQMDRRGKVFTSILSLNNLYILDTVLGLRKSSCSWFIVDVFVFLDNKELGEITYNNGKFNYTTSSSSDLNEFKKKYGEDRIKSVGRKLMSFDVLCSLNNYYEKVLPMLILNMLYIFKKMYKITEYDNYKMFKVLYTEPVQDVYTISTREVFAITLSRIIRSEENIEFNTIITQNNKDIIEHFFEKISNILEEHRRKVQEKGIDVNPKNLLKIYDDIISDFRNSDFISNNVTLNDYLKGKDKIVELTYNEMLYVFFSKLEQDDSHVTFKLKQALNYYDNNFFFYVDEIEKIENSDVLSLSLDSKYFDKLKQQSELNKGDIINNMPLAMVQPNISVTKIVDGKDKEYDFRALSSGEQQLIHSLLTVSYHIYNLKSISTGIVYKEINLVCDEIELYFHPEYQRVFVKELIGTLSYFEEMKYNILLSTHSPFILSDIPSQNVLKLKEGKPEESVKGDEVNSFGANIHDLLADEFFLKNGFMGEFAKGKISSVVDFLTVSLLASKEKRSKEEEEKINNIKSKAGYVEYTRDNCRLIIDSIGESILRYNIEELYQQFLLIEDDKEDSIKKEIARLEATLQELRRKGGEKR